MLHRGLNEKYSDALFTAMGLAAAGLGINTIVKYMPKSQYPVLFIVSLALGILIGAMLDLDGRFNRFVSSRSGGNLAQGLSTGIMLYCMGALSILGPIQSALYGDNTFLFTNATLDLITSAVLASTYGIGMIFAAPVLFCWQGGIYLLALAGQFHVRRPDGRDLDRRRLHDRRIRTFYIENGKFQDHEHAPGTGGSTAVVYFAALYPLKEYNMIRRRQRERY